MEETLDAIAGSARHYIPGCDEVGISLVRADGKVETKAATGDLEARRPPVRTNGADGNDRGCHTSAVSDAHAPTDGDFLKADEQYLTPAMNDHGYVVCSAGDGKASDGQVSALRRVQSWRAHKLFRNRISWPRRTRLVRHLSVGYEGDSGKEFWVGYFPERHGLDLTDWRRVLRNRAELDVYGSEPVDREELRRRLRTLGDAVRAAESLEGG
jgi:hypothetical protein